MRLSVHWENATRPIGQRYTVEALYSQALMDIFGSPEKAAACKEDFLIKYEPPGHPWLEANKRAKETACAGLGPTERNMSHLIVKFDI